MIKLWKKTLDVDNILASEGITNDIKPVDTPWNQKKLLDKFITVLSLVFAIYMFYATIFGPYKTTIVHRALFLLVTLFIYFTSNSPLQIGKKGRFKTIARVVNAIIVVCMVICLCYIIINYEQLLGALGATYLKAYQIILGLTLILIILEAARRNNSVFFILASLGFIYTMYGNHLTGVLNHPGMSLKRIVYLTTYVEEGIFGLGMSVASTYLFMFILFGAVLQGTGASVYLMDLCNALVGKLDGGPAKTAVIGSAAMGTVSGSSISNVVTTGSITIPMMKKLGFKPHVAAAVEVTASEGGQLMPPVMGAAAFIMAEMTGIPYSNIAIAAIIPALLYFLNAYFVVHFEAKKSGIKGLTKEEIPEWKRTLVAGWHVITPIFVLFYLLMGKSYTAMYSGFVSIILTFILAQCRRHTRITFTQFIKIIENGVRDVSGLVALLAGLGMVTQAIIITGLGARLSEILVSLVHGSKIGIALIGMVVTLILGCGMTTPLAYSLAAMFVAPSLVIMGFPVLPTHLFLFFFAIKSGSTPPVAVVAAVAAGIAKANFWETAIKSTIFGSATFLVAFTYLYNPALLLSGEPSFIIVSILGAIIGVICMAGAIQGWMFMHCTVWERVALFIGALCLIIPEITTDAIGIVLVAVVTAINLRNAKKHAPVNG